MVVQGETIRCKTFLSTLDDLLLIFTRESIHYRTGKELRL
jgi:hypothetical protein